MCSKRVDEAWECKARASEQLRAMVSISHPTLKRTEDQVIKKEKKNPQHSDTDFNVDYHGSGKSFEAFRSAPSTLTDYITKRSASNQSTPYFPDNTYTWIQSDSNTAQEGRKGASDQQSGETSDHHIRIKRQFCGWHQHGKQNWNVHPTLLDISGYMKTIRSEMCAWHPEDTDRIKNFRHRLYIP